MLGDHFDGPFHRCFVEESTGVDVSMLESTPPLLLRRSMQSTRRARQSLATRSRSCCKSPASRSQVTRNPSPTRIPIDLQRVGNASPDGQNRPSGDQKSSRNRPGGSQERPRAPKSPPRAPKSGPRAPQERPKSLPRAAKSAPGAPKSAPRAAQERPETPQTALGAPF